MEKVGALVNRARLKDARLKADMSRADLANAIGTSERNIARWETTPTQPRLSSVALIAKATGHDIEFFLSSDSEDEDEEAASLPLTRDKDMLARLGHYLVATFDPEEKI